MQTLANMSGVDSVYRQVEVNQDSLSRLRGYYSKYKQIMLLQMKVVDRRKHHHRSMPAHSTRGATPLVAHDNASRRIVPPLQKTSSSLFHGRDKETNKLIYPRAPDSIENSKADDVAPFAGELLVSHIER